MIRAFFPMIVAGLLFTGLPVPVQDLTGLSTLELTNDADARSRNKKRARRAEQRLIAAFGGTARPGVNGGVEIVTVNPGGWLDQNLFIPGDVILAVDAQPTNDLLSLAIELLANPDGTPRAAGSTVVLTVRDAEVFTIEEVEVIIPNA